MKDDQVSTLQQWLSKTKKFIRRLLSAVTTALTEKAVQKFQEKYDIAGVGKAGYGVVGPKTRAKLFEIFGSDQY